MPDTERHSPPLSYRLLTEGDAEGIHRVALDSWRHAYGSWLTPEFIEERVGATYSRQELDDVRTAVQKGVAVFWVAVEGERVVGFAYVADRGDGWELVRLYVLPSHFDRGVGSELVRLAEEFVRSKGAVSYFCYVHRANVRAMRFYGRKGIRSCAGKGQGAASAVAHAQEAALRPMAGAHATPAIGESVA